MTAGFGGAARPAISPDGKTLTFVSRRDDDTVLVPRDLATGAETRPRAAGVTRDEKEGFAQMDLWPGYAFTPDGAAIVFSNQRQAARGSTWPPARSTGDPVHREGRAVAGAARRLAGEGRDRSGPGAHPALAQPVARREADRLRGLRPRLAPGARRRQGRRARRAASPGTPPACPRASTRRPSRPTASGSPTSPGATPTAATSGRRRPTAAARPRAHDARPATTPTRRGRRTGDRIAILRGSGLEFRGRQPEDEDFFELRAGSTRPAATRTP